MLESLNTGVFEYEKLKPEEMQRRGILGRLVGVMADTVNPTRNGRSYSEKLWENVFNNPIMQERIENKCCFGELGHPLDREETDMEKIAICMDGLPKKDSDGKLQAVFNILDTPNGRILKTLCDYGCNIGISSRGSGDLVQDFDGNESVDPDTYNCEGWDAVLIPAVKEARLQYVNESLDKTRYNKSLRTKLQEAVEKADEDHRISMKESIHTFLGESIWDEIESDSNNVEEPEIGPEPNEDYINELDKNIEDNQNNEPVDESENEDNALDNDSSVDDLDLSFLDDEPEGPKKENYKGAEIIQDENSGKFVCEINQETYVFNSEKNAKIWIDMNEKEVQKDIKDREKKAVIDEIEGNYNEDNEEKQEEESVQESLNEHFTDGKSDDEIIQEFVEACKLKLDNDSRTEIELEIPEDRYTDNFFYDLEDYARDKGIGLSLQDSMELEGFVYLHFYAHRMSWFEESLNEEQVGRDTHKEDKDVDKVMKPEIKEKPQSDQDKEKDSEEEEDDDSMTIVIEDFEKRLKIEEENAKLNEDINYKEVVDDKSSIDSLQEMLERNIALEKQIKELQEKLSVSNAEENKVLEDLAIYRDKTFELSEENRSLKEKLAKENDSAKKLNESVSKNNSLREQLRTITEDKRNIETELSELKESYANLDKDHSQLQEQYSKRFERQNKLLEKYQKITKKSVDSYINLQAKNLGIKSAEIRNKLPEQFTFSDIDSICEDLRSYKLNISQLPFNSKTLNEGSIKVNNLRENLIPKNEMDELTDYDLKLMEMFK